jgi:hypothetical protein
MREAQKHRSNEMKEDIVIPFDQTAAAHVRANPMLELVPLLQLMRANGWCPFTSWQGRELAQVELEFRDAKDFLNLMATQLPSCSLRETVTPMIDQGSTANLSTIPERWTISAKCYDLVKDEHDAPWVNVNPRQSLVTVTIRFPKTDLPRIVTGLRCETPELRHAA